MVNKLEKAGVIRRYHPLFGSSRVTTLLHTLSHKNSVRKDSGLYKLGHGEKSIIWYWEFDIEKRYFHQFRTIDYAATVEFYKANKFTMWGKREQRVMRKMPRRESESKEQSEASTNVQD